MGADDGEFVKITSSLRLKTSPYEGLSVGDVEGEAEGNDDGSAVGLPATYVGDKDGDCVGIDDGVDVGRGVGVPTE